MVLLSHPLRVPRSHEHVPSSFLDVVVPTLQFLALLHTSAAAFGGAALTNTAEPAAACADAAAFSAIEISCRRGLLGRSFWALSSSSPLITTLLTDERLVIIYEYRVVFISVAT